MDHDRVARGLCRPAHLALCPPASRPAHRDYNLGEPRPEEWLLVEWPAEEREPTKCWLSTLPEDIAFPRLVDLAKLRWRIERDYQELKQELGLGHYEGRGWRGFHHHATMCMAAYAFRRRTGGNFPLGTARGRRTQGVSPSRRVSTPRRRRSGQSATCRTQSQP